MSICNPTIRKNARRMYARGWKIGAICKLLRLSRSEARQVLGLPDNQRGRPPQARFYRSLLAARELVSEGRDKAAVLAMFPEVSEEDL